ncbi:MAG: complex I NDUFA9 subunit family protein [Gemmatimonadaceae bacterium]
MLVTGAAGLVGVHTCRELVRRGWKVRALVRDGAKGASRLGEQKLELRVGDIRDERALAASLEGASAVVHLAAIAIETGKDSYESTNTDATATLLRLAASAGATRFIHMSQNGASSASPYDFLRSKGLAEDAVRASGLKWTVLKPSVIFGPQDAFINVLARMIRLSPLVFPIPGGGRARFQPIAVRDVASAIGVALDRDDTIGSAYGLGGPAPLSLREMTERILVAMRTQRMLLPVSVAVLRPLVALMQKIVPRPPVTTGLLDLLSIDNTVPENEIQRTFGIEPIPFAPEEIGYVRSVTLRNAIESMF